MSRSEIDDLRSPSQSSSLDVPPGHGQRLPRQDNLVLDKMALRTAFYHLAILAAGVLAFLLAVQVRTDLAVGWVDSAIYHTLFLSKASIVSRFGDVYFFTRWPWIFLGSQFYNNFSPTTASFLLTLTTMWIIGFGNYLFARSFISPQFALLVSLLSTCNLQVAQTVASGYPSAIAYGIFCLATALSRVGNRSNSVVLLILAGFGYGMAAITQNFIVVIGAAIYLALLIERLSKLRWTMVVRNELLTILGATLVIPLTILVLHTFGSSGRAFNTLALTAQYAVQGQGAGFRKGLAQLLLDGGAFVVLLSGLACIILSLRRAGWRPGNLEPRHLAAHLTLLLPLLLLACFDLFAGGATLQYGFYQVFLYGPALLQIGVWMDGAAAEAKPAARTVAVAMAATLLVLMAILGLLDTGIALPDVIIFVGMFWLLVLLILLQVDGGKARSGIASSLAGLVFLVTVAVSSNLTRYALMAHAPDESGSQGLDTVQWVLGLAAKHAKQGAPLLVAYDRTDITLPADYPVRNDRWSFVYNGKYSYFTIFDSIAGVSLWDRGTIATLASDIDMSLAKTMIGYHGYAAVVVLWENADFRLPVGKAAAAAGLTSVEQETGRFESGTVDFSYAVLRLVPTPK